MKKKILSALLLFFIILSCVFVSSPVKTPVAAAAEGENSEAEVLKSRFLNMLNHNFVYGEAFYSTESLINSSMPALLDLRDSEDEDFIAEKYVRDYVFNMYGLELGNIENINADFPTKKGFVFIIPRGFSVYSHELLKIKENEDGSFTVTTQVYIDDHDANESALLCETLFAKNDASSFGFTIEYSKFFDVFNKI